MARFRLKPLLQNLSPTGFWQIDCIIYQEKVQSEDQEESRAQKVHIPRLACHLVITHIFFLG